MNVDKLKAEYQELMLTNRQYAFARILDGHAVITAVNNDESRAHVSIPVPIEMHTCKNAMTGEPITAQGGRIELELEPCSGICIKINE